MKTAKTVLHTLLLALFAALATHCTQAQNHEETAADTTLHRDIGEMLLVGFRDTLLSSSSHIVRDIRDYGIGGVILFEYDAPSRSRPRNISSPKQFRQLCAQLQEIASEPLLIGIDQEGGSVSRLKERYGFPAFLSAQQTAYLGRDTVMHYAQLTASILHRLGINLNFAPCTDVNTNPDCPIIGKLGRSFGSSPDEVANCADIWVAAQSGHNVISCLKHFPGHGSSRHDTHLGLADVSTTWDPTELSPYITLISKGYSQMIMTTHVFNSQIDSLYPATLSHSTLTSLLRDSLHFTGVIITDDLAMGAMTQAHPYPELLRLAINAGADMLCISNNGTDYNADIVPQTVEIIFRMVQTGEIPASRIHESAARVRKLKNDCLQPQRQHTSTNQ